MFVIAKQAEQALSEFDQISQFQLIVGRKGERDELVLKLELMDESTNKDQLSGRVLERFPQICRVRPDKIEWVAKGTIPKERQTIVDERKWE